MATDDNRDEIQHLVTECCEVPAPDDEFVKALAARSRQELSLALQGGSQAEARPVRARPAAARRWTKVALASAGFLAMTLVTAWFWNARESRAWAQVVDAVRARPWLHGLAKNVPDAQGHAGNFEVWVSMKSPIAATRYGSQAIYDDGPAGVRAEYDPLKQEIYHVPALADMQQGIRSIQAVFRDLFRGQEVVGRDFDGGRIVKQERRRVSTSGQEWVLYTLWLESPAGPGRVVFRVDPRTMLPQSAECFDSRSPEADAKPVVSCILDYPETGPADIYALGVPRSAKVVDRMPKPDLARVLAAVNVNRKRFANSYYAIVAQTWDFQGQSHRWWEAVQLTQVWCKGDCWRVERGSPRSLKPPTFAYAPAEPPGANVDKMAWWKKHLQDFALQPTSVCDGRAMYAPKKGPTAANGNTVWEFWSRVTPGQGRLPAGPFGPAGANMPELRAYSMLLQTPSRDVTAELVPNPSEGPTGAVMVKCRDMRDASRSGILEYRLWVDPARSFVTLREDTYAPAGPGAGHAAQWHTWLSEEFAQTPSGIWYATVARWMSTDQVASPHKDGLVYRFFVDFKADIPDSLFQPGPVAAVKATTPPPPGHGGNDLRDIGLAMQRYQDVHWRFPAAYTVDNQGQPLLSWRVELLPWLGQEKLYKQFHLDEAWDSPSNRPLIEKMPDIFGSPDPRSKEKGRTRYVVPVGKETVFPGSKPMSVSDIRDGCANTIMAVEVDDDHAVIWTRPQDLPFNAENPAEGLAALPKGGFWALLCDGSFRWIPKEFDPKSLRGAFTRAGGEAIEW